MALEAAVDTLEEIKGRVCALETRIAVLEAARTSPPEPIPDSFAGLLELREELRRAGIEVSFGASPIHAACEAVAALAALRAERDDTRAALLREAELLVAMALKFTPPGVDGGAAWVSQANRFLDSARTAPGRVPTGLTPAEGNRLRPLTGV